MRFNRLSFGSIGLAKVLFPLSFQRHSLNHLTPSTPSIRTMASASMDDSGPLGEYPTDVQSLAKYIMSDKCKSISVLCGAGISVASGIPDFRSPGGMYDTLRPSLITASPYERRLMESDPTYVVSWDIFKSNAFPYLEVRRPFILGTQQQQWKATLGHWFFDLLEKHTNKLTRIYTQNIDGLFYQLDNVPRDKIVDVHGTIANVSCESCGHSMPLDEFCDKVQTHIKDIYDIDEAAPAESKPIVCNSCQKPTVKPTTVLFGRSLPEEFWVHAESDMPKTDLLLIAGTSLVVSPANSLVYRVSESSARVLINREPAGQDLGMQFRQNRPGKNRDLHLQGDADRVFFQLAQELGWLEDLKAIKDRLPPESAALLDDQ